MHRSLTSTLKWLAAGWLLAAAVSVAAQAPRAPALVPAQRVAHAPQATMLAATRAGQRIVAVGDHGVVLLSDDDGKRFRQAQAVPVDAALTAVSFADAQHGWATGHWGVILHTRDGGEHWTVQRSDVTTDRPLFALKFLDARHGVAVGLWSLVLRTDDGGAHWHPVQMPVPERAKKADLNLLGLFSDARGRLFATAERGMLARSDDQGLTWTYLSTGYTGSFWTGLALADGGLLAAGLRGSLYRSGDDGRSWSRIDTQSKSSITALAQSGAQVVGVGLDGLLLRSADAGASFRSEVRADRRSLTALVLGADGQPVPFSRQGVLPHGLAATESPK